MGEIRQETEFLFTYPLFVLASDLVFEEGTGDIIFDDDSMLIAPLVGDEQHLALFTDEYLAEEFLSLAQWPSAIAAFALDRGGVISLLRKFRVAFQWVVVDLNLKAGPARSFRVDELIEFFEADQG